MRKLISLNLFVTGFVVLGVTAQAKTETPKSCESFLAEELLPATSKVIELEPVVVTNQDSDAADEVMKNYPQKLVDTLGKARAMMDKAKELNFITKSKYDHLLEDLEELSRELDKKSKNATFMEMTNQWYDFATRLEAQLEAYQALSAKEQKLYFEKMKMPISFMTSHFITFLETKHLKFSYQQMYSILKNSAELDSKADLVLYLYEFEKQVLKFFSKDEFIDCQA